MHAHHHENHSQQTGTPHWSASLWHSTTCTGRWVSPDSLHCAKVVNMDASPASSEPWHMHHPVVRRPAIHSTHDKKLPQSIKILAAHWCTAIVPGALWPAKLQFNKIHVWSYMDAGGPGKRVHFSWWAGQGLHACAQG